MLEQHGLGELGRELNHLSKTGGWDRMATLIDDDTVRLFAAVGRHDEIASVIAERFGGLSDSIALGTGIDEITVPPDLLDDIRAI